MRYKSDFLLSLLSGILLALSFYPPYLSFLGWFAIFPLLLTLRRGNLKLAFLKGFLTGFVFFLILYYWLLALFPWGSYFVILALLALSFFHALSIAVFSAGAFYFYRYFSLFWRLFLIPSLWISLEFLRAQGPYGFSWGSLGYSQAFNVFLIQFARISGVFGVSFLLALFSSFLAEFFSLSLSWKKLLGTSIVLILIFVAVFSYGFYVLRSFSGKKTFRVAIVQGNILPQEKGDVDTGDKIRRAYLKLTKKAAKENPFLIIWPETTTPLPFYDEAEYTKKLKEMAGRKNFYLLLGSFYYKRGRLYNSAFLISPYGKVTGRYDKVRLVPFGEYVPRLYPFLKIKEILNLDEDVYPGEEQRLLRVKSKKVGVLICFESETPNLCRRAVLSGANLITVLTNDSWFGKSAASYEHFVIASLRAVENGVYVVQAANTGVSGIIDPCGRVIVKSPLFKQRVLTGKVSFVRDKKTFYTLFGDVFSYLCLAFVLAAFCILSLKIKRY